MTASSPPLSWRELRKSYGSVEVLRGLDATVPGGAVFGFVGLNGAGKTTTIECSLGLLRGYRGEVRILGALPHRLSTVPGQVGAVFDAPSLHGHLSVRRALELAFIQAGGEGRTPAEVEELLGLGRHRRRKVRKLSWGNRRRASIAAALVGRPRLVILDEPFSGLDAEGVDDLLALLSRLRDQDGTTFVVSSHQLHHVEKICTHICVLHEGSIAAQGTVESLLGEQSPTIEVTVDEPRRAREVLESGGRAGKGGDDDDTLVVESDGVEPATLNADLVRHGLAVSRLVSRRPSLEQLFREITGGSAT